MLIRKPVVAGSFYPSSRSAIQQFCEPRLISHTEAVSARAVVLPHAGYIYSGDTACRVLACVQVPEKNLMIGPNHHGYGADFALYAQGQWETPLGRVSIGEDLAGRILEGAEGVVEDTRAHEEEHCLEVIVPLLQMKNAHAKILPLLVGSLDLERTREVAQSLAAVLAAEQDRVLLVISNDMSHFDEDEETRKKDRFALQAIENLDADALAKVVRQYRITMCGFVPVFMLLVMAERLGIRKATLVDYRTSADATGDKDRVVGYAGFVFE